MKFHTPIPGEQWEGDCEVILRRAHTLELPGECDVALRRGTIAAIGSALASRANQDLDLGGALLLPGFVDSHVHLDKAFLCEEPEIRGTTGGKFFAALREFKRNTKKAEIKPRMRRALELASSHGTTCVRAQIDVDDVIGLAGLEAALELREECRKWMDVQLVAFPQEGLLARAGLLGLLREALMLGADVIGGGPSFDSVPAPEHLRTVFQLAQEYDRDVDLHVDLSTRAECPAGEWEVAGVAELTRSIGWEGRVTVAHLRGTGAMTPAQADPLLTLMREAGISVTVVPGAELNTARTWWEPPTRDITRAMTNVEGLVKAGIVVSYSTGHIGDPFNPYGNASMLGDAFLLAAAYNLGEPSIAGVPILRLGTSEPWRATRMPGPAGLTVGRTADLVLLEGKDPGSAVRHQAKVLSVFKGGSLVVERGSTTRAAWRGDNLSVSPRNK